MSATKPISPESAQAAFDRDFLAARAKLLEIASWLDRVDRCEGVPTDDRRINQIHQGIAALSKQVTNRAELIQQIFSLDFNENWQQDFSVSGDQ